MVVKVVVFAVAKAMVLTRRARGVAGAIGGVMD